MKVYVLTRDAADTRSGKAEVLGAVTDPDDLARVLYDPDAMPSDAKIMEREVEILADGRMVYAQLNEFVEVPVFSLSTWNAEQADNDAAIAALPAPARVRLHPGHRSEAEKKADRAALRAERVSPEMLAQQDAANAAALAEAMAKNAEAKTKGKP